MNIFKRKSPSILIFTFLASISASYAADPGEQTRVRKLSYHEQLNVDKKLWAAARSGNVQEAEAALQQGARPNSYDPFGGTPPLHIASEKGHLEVVKLLLKANASVDLQYMQLYLCFDAPLFAAMAGKHGNVVAVAEELIKAKANINSTNTSDDPLLQVAAYNGQCDMIEKLLDYGMDVNAPDDNGRTPLHSAVAGSCLKTIDLLLAKKADINARDERGNTLLHVASDFYSNEKSTNEDDILKSKHKYDILKRFIKEKLLDVNISNINGNTPLHKAAAHGNREAMVLLLDKGANIRAANEEGKTPIAFVIYYLHSRDSLPLIEFFLKNYNQDGMLLGVDIYGDTLLHVVASRNQNIELLQILFKAGLDPYQKNHRNKTPLCIAKKEVQLAGELHLFTVVLPEFISVKDIIDLIKDYYGNGKFLDEEPRAPIIEALKIPKSLSHPGPGRLPPLGNNMKKEPVKVGNRGVDPAVYLRNAILVGLVGAATWWFCP